MTTAVMAEPIPGAAPRSKGRAAGFFWLMTIFAGMFAEFGARGLVVSGDAAATATNILTRESLYRLGIAANLAAGVCYVVATLLVYDLLKPVNRSMSLVAAAFSLMGCTVGVFADAFRLAPLVVLRDAPHLSVFAPEQVQALALTPLRLAGVAGIFGFVFFGLHCLLVGFLILRSTFLPRAVGALMVLAGVGWLSLSLSNLLWPAFGRSLVPFAMASGLLGEGSLTLWLLMIGVDARRWKEQAGEKRP